MGTHLRYTFALLAVLVLAGAVVLGLATVRTKVRTTLAVDGPASDPAAPASPAPNQLNPREERVLSQVPPEKPALLDREVAEKVASRVAPPRQAGDPGPFQPADLPRTPAGAGTIVEDGQAPFSGQFFHFENRWWEAKDGEEIVVYAGLARTEPEQGIVIVTTTKSNECGMYRTPIRAGALSVVGAEGERLTLATRSGATFVFDVPSRTFVEP